MSEAALRWINGPVLRARTEHPFRLNEEVEVGERGLLGEVIQLDGSDIVVQVYEDTTGLRPGDPVRGRGQPLSVRLGPGLLGHLFDGLLRPLLVHGDFVEAGAPVVPSARYGFTPAVGVGDRVEAGSVFGTLAVPTVAERRCIVPPGVAGQVLRVASAAEHTGEEILCVVELPDGGQRELMAGERWPVRRPRPAAERLEANRPMLTGQRILDTLFPIARGGRASLPGGFGTGKTVLQQTLAKWSDADVVVYVGCGERGNEMAEVLEDFPALEDPRTGRPLLERTVVIANTSNMPVAAREASIYTGITVAEYLRDRGLHVALMADSTSRWAEALREISGRLGELPAESGYPAYLSSRLADFYERAGNVRTLSGEEASITLIGAVSPPGGDFSEPVTKHTQRYVRCLWSLDPERARARLYPAIHPLASYSQDVAAFVGWWTAEGNARWAEHRRRLLSLLEEQARLERMARIVGKDALPRAQQLTLLCAELVTDAFLRQSALSPVDAYCAAPRQSAMLRVLVHFIDLAMAAVDAGQDIARIAELPILRRLERMAEEIGNDSVDRFDELVRLLDESFAPLLRKQAVT